MKLLFLIITLTITCLLIQESLIAQVQISRSVFGSFGGEVNNGQLYMMHNIGETFINTSEVNPNLILTQGFEQPNEGLTVSFLLRAATCNSATDGLAKVIIRGSGTYTYEFNGSVVSVSSDTLFLGNLLPGDYEVYITDQITEFQALYSFTILSASSEPCGVFAYTGISPNGDGFDDIWFIDGIENYLDNQVHIYDRWGNLIWEIKGYDNNNNVWNGKRFNQTELPTGTYFFVIEIKELKTMKGWVQITK